MKMNTDAPSGRAVVDRERLLAVVLKQQVALSESAPGYALQGVDAVRIVFDNRHDFFVFGPSMTVVPNSVLQ